MTTQWRTKLLEQLERLHCELRKIVAELESYRGTAEAENAVTLLTRAGTQVKEAMDALSGDSSRGSGIQKPAIKNW